MQSRTEHGLMTAQDLLDANPEALLRDQEDVFRVVEQVRAYDPNLDVAYLDPDKGSISDAPYVIVEHCRDGKTRLLFSVWKLDASVMDRIIAADTTKFDVEGAIDLANAKAKKELEAKSKERFGEAQDITSHILANPKGTYSFPNTAGETVTLRDDEGIIKREPG
jgi:hypothetical protein